MITHLADSDWVIDYLRKQDAALRLLSPLIEGSLLAISVITYAEVYEGIVGGRHERTSGLNGLRDFIRGAAIMGIDQETAEQFAQLRAVLRARGALLADHDTWIASTAMRHDLILLTRDHHFDRIDSLKRS